MPITKNKKYDHCECDAIRVKSGPHYAKLVTRKGNHYIQWLSKKDYDKIQKIKD